ncbi:MAG: TerC family protein [Rhizobiales bacterium]|nr:TerC family protein [Hyphomicrobiales bacterium]
MDVLTEAFLGQPLWMWLAFLTLVAMLLALDLGIFHRSAKAIGARESLVLSAFYMGLGLAFGGFVWWQLGARSGMEYMTGFVIEKSLAMDNIFVIATIFGYLAIPREYQHRVLFWGILGVIVLRAIMIGLGATIVAEYSWVLYLFACFLILTGIKMIWWADQETDISRNPLLLFLRRRLNVTETLHGNRFFVRQHDSATGKSKTYVTPLFLALVLIEVADVIFAVDSVPAIFAITTDAYIVYTSNIFAILGLRALYFALAAVIHRFAFLKQALAVLLVFIGSKIFIADALGWAKFPAELSLGITFAILAAGVLYSVWRTRSPERDRAAA